MKATELRLGNLYQWLHEEHETFEVVDIYFLTTQEIYDKDPEDEIFCRGWWPEPIPLDREWLARLGFKQKYTSDPQESNCSEVYFIGDFCLHTTNDSSKFFFYSYENLMCEIKSVHQLQNLYYALTGEELPVKPH